MSSSTSIEVEPSILRNLIPPSKLTLANLCHAHPFPKQALPLLLKIHTHLANNINNDIDNINNNYNGNLTAQQLQILSDLYSEYQLNKEIESILESQNDLLLRCDLSIRLMILFLNLAINKHDIMIFEHLLELLEDWFELVNGIADSMLKSEANPYGDDAKALKQLTIIYYKYHQIIANNCIELLKTQYNSTNDNNNDKSIITKRLLRYFHLQDRNNAGLTNDDKLVTTIENYNDKTIKKKYSKLIESNTAANTDTNLVDGKQQS